MHTCRALPFEKHQTFKLILGVVVIGKALIFVYFPLFFYRKSMSSGGKCCGGGGGGSKYPQMMAVEAFDDGTPLSFYRQQVAQMYGSGGSGAHGGGHGGGHNGGMSYSGGMSSGGHKKPSMQLNQLYKSSFGYQNMLMGGGFMGKDRTGFGPSGTHTSKKWRGFAKGLLSKAKSGYGKSSDKLTNVHVVASGATDEYKDSYLTMITNTLKRGGGY